MSKMPVSHYKCIPLLLLITLIFVNSCDLKQDDEIVLLRTNAFSGSGVDSWVIISDHRGRVLDYRETTGLQGVLEFEGVSSDPITVTHIRVISHQNGPDTNFSYNLRTYIGVPSGSTYIRDVAKEVETSPSESSGNAFFTLLNYSGSDDPFYSIGISDGSALLNTFGTYDNWSYDGSTFMGELPLRNDIQDILISTYNGDIPVYEWVRDVSAGDSIEVDFNSFNPMNPVPVYSSVPAHFGYIRGLSEPSLASPAYDFSRSDYWMFSHAFDANSSVILGYLDGFEYYDTYIQDGSFACCEQTNTVAYHKLGTGVPNDIELPDYTIDIKNSNLLKFDIDFDGSYTYVRLYGSLTVENNTLQWTVNAPDHSSVKLPNIPKEILATFPFLNRDNIQTDLAAFTDNLDSYSYTDHLKDLFELTLNRSEFEHQRITVRF